MQSRMSADGRIVAARTVSIVAIVAALAPFSLGTALADCSTNAPVSGDVVICVPEGGDDDSGVVNELADDVSLELRGSGAAIRVTETGSAIQLDDRATVVMQPGTTVDAATEGITVDDDATIVVDGNILSAGKGRAAISAGDRLTLAIGAGATVEAAGTGSNGVRARDGARITVAGRVVASGESTDDDAFRAAAGLRVDGDDARIVVTSTGSIDTAGAAVGGIETFRNARVVVDGSIVTRGGSVESDVLNSFAHGVSVRQGSTVTVGSSGTITTLGERAGGIVLEGDVDEYDDETLGVVTVAGRVEAFGPGSAGVRVEASRNIFGGGSTGRPVATINVEAGGHVGSQRSIAIFEVPESALSRPVDTTVRIAGEVASGAGVAVFLGGGDDEVVLLPTHGVDGLLIGSNLDGDGNVISDEGETDRFTLDGAVGTFGRFALNLGGDEQVLGFETLTKTGAGTWTLDGGASSFAANGRVEAGRLNIDAEIPDLRLEIANGAVLGGTGVVGPIFAFEDAVVAPGVGILRSSGDVDISQGSTLMISSGDDGRTSRLSADGSADIGGGVLMVDVAPDQMSATNGAVVLSAEGGIEGRFATVRDTLPDVDVVPDYGTGNVALGYRLAAEGGLVSDKSIYAETISGLLEFQFATLRNLHRRGTGQGAGTVTASLGGSADEGPSEPSADRFGPVAWLEGSTHGIDARDANRDGFALASAGIVGGIELQGEFGDGVATLGAGAGYRNAVVEAPGGRADADIAHLGVYGEWQREAFTVGGAFEVGRARIDTVRDVAGVATARSDADATLYAAALSASYNLAPRLGLPERTIIAPQVMVDLAGLTISSFEETGAGELGLSGGGDSFHRGLAGLGIVLGTTIDAGTDWTVSPTVSLAYQHGFGERRTGTVLDLAIVDAELASQSVSVARDRFSIGAGLSVARGERLSLSATYQGSFGSDYQSHAGSLGFSYRF